MDGVLVICYGSGGCVDGEYCLCVFMCVCAWWYCMYRCMYVGILACRYVSMDRYVF